jgi:2-polyprenyl-6-methoxyphenol hydroxylase-like FAD-dependent oxidoreductase
MNSAVAPRALIIGGSLGGLFAATALRATGWDVQVFERSPQELSSRGGGVVLQPDVIEVFDFAGLKFQRPLGVRSGDRIYLDQKDEVVQRSYMPQTQTSWNTLYGVMKRSLPAELVHSGERFVSFEQNGDKVTAHFASGRRETGDLLIGADGAQSSVRAQLTPRH